MGTFLSFKSRTAKSSLPYKNLNYISFILDWCDAKQKKYLLCKPADWQQANNICFCIFIKVECVTYRESWSTGVTIDLALVASLPRSDCRSQCHFYCQWLPLQRLQETHRSLRTTPCLVIKSSWLLHSYTMWKFTFYILCWNAPLSYRWIDKPIARTWRCIV